MYFYTVFMHNTRSYCPDLNPFLGRQTVLTLKQNARPNMLLRCNIDVYNKRNPSSALVISNVLLCISVPFLNSYRWRSTSFFMLYLLIGNTAMQPSKAQFKLKGKWSTSVSLNTPLFCITFLSVEGFKPITEWYCQVILVFYVE